MTKEREASEGTPMCKEIMLFATSPLCPKVRGIEDLPLFTPQGSSCMELRSTSVLPISTGAAIRVLGKIGETLLASKVRSKRRIIPYDQVDGKKRVAVSDDLGGVKKQSKVSTESVVGGSEGEMYKIVIDVKEAEKREESDLKDMVVRLMHRVSRLESQNPELYAPLMINRSLAVANLLLTVLGMLDSSVAE